MKTKTHNSRILLASIICLLSSTIIAQNSVSPVPVKDSTTCSIKLNVGVDLCSRYIFRGTDFGNSPAIQPVLSLGNTHWEVGAWGSIATNSFYKELDLYAKFNWHALSLMVTDYYIPSITGTPASADTRYFNLKDKTTSHTLEACLMFKGGEKFPAWIQACGFVYGNDKRWGFNAVKDIKEETYYSCYFEAGYSFSVQQNNLDLFCGVTPQAGAYGNSAGVVNLGLAGTKKIKFSDAVEIPVKASLIFNPQASMAYFVLAVSL